MRLINADRLIMELLRLRQYFLERKRAKETMIIWTVITRVNEMAEEEMWKHELSKERQRTANTSPTHECVKPTHECISREDAMMEARPEYLNPNQKGHEEYNKAWNDGVKTYWNGLKALPSAQPEIIRCKNCKHIQKWRSEESAKKFGQIYACARNVFNCPKPEDFCSYAERRADG